MDNNELEKVLDEYFNMINFENYYVGKYIEM